jgi:hypothetical protein
MESHRPLVILDLDETIISAIEMNELHNVPHPEKFHSVNLEDIYQVFERPGLQQFLDILFDKYRVGVWTAAGLTYGLFIIKNFIVKDKEDRNLEFFMWDDHCTYSYRTSKGQAKCIKLLDPLFKYNNVVLLDDNEYVLKQTNVTIDSEKFNVMNKYAHMDTFLNHANKKIERYFDDKHNKIILRNEIHKLI